MQTWLILSTISLSLWFLYSTSLFELVKKWLTLLGDRLHIYSFYSIPQYNDQFQENQLYLKVLMYIDSLPSLQDSDAVTLFSMDKSGDIVMCLDHDQSVSDVYSRARVSWVYRTLSNGLGGEFVLKVKRKDMKRILQPYIQRIYKVTNEIEQRKKELRIHLYRSSGDNGLSNGRWRSFPLVHPATFDTVVIDDAVKNKVKSDLELFLKSKQYYNKLGRSWKRSYLLYGQSGTGKSTFAAAMANFLQYDVYDVDLSNITNDSDFKTALLQTNKKSLILIENLDLYLMGKSNSVSLSTILNTMDGVISCCGEERVMVFTMNCKYQIDQVILRPGRVHVQIFFPLCDFNSFKSLAYTHLKIKNHVLFGQIEDSFRAGGLSLAEISEIMISNRSSTSRALKSVVKALENSVGANELRKVRRSSSESETDRDANNSDMSGSLKQRKSVPGMKEIQKFYGQFRLRGSKKEESTGSGVNEKEDSHHGL